MSNSIRSLPSSPPSASRSSYTGMRSPGPESRPLSMVSSPHAPVAVPAYETLGPGQSSQGDSTNVVHAYNTFVGNTMVDIVIRISTPKDSRDSTLTLTCQAGGVERIIGDPQTLRLSNPSQAEFSIYFIPRESAPLNALHKLRIWLTTPELQVRLWADDEFWLGAQLPFPAIQGARLARLSHSSPLFHVYNGSVGEASVSYMVSIDPVAYAPTHDEYSISLRYEAGGISRELCSNLRVRLSCDIKDISFIIYAMRQESDPKGGRHKFRLWIRSAIGGICQRLWAADDIWLGRNLHFETVQQGNVIFARRGTSSSIIPRLDAFSDALDLPAYSAAPHDEIQ